MSKYLKFFIGVIVLSFLWGAGWGFYQSRYLLNKNSSQTTIRWLTPRGFLTPEMIEMLSQLNDVHLQVVEKGSDADLLREALTFNNEFDLIQISSYVAKSFLIDHVFLPLNHEELPNEKDISIDFKSMDFDLDNKYLVPLTWGLNGFLIQTEKVHLNDETIEEILNLKAEKSLLRSPIDLFHISIKLRPIVKSWVETGQKDELRGVIKEIKPLFASYDPKALDKFLSGQLQIVQASSGQVASIVDEKKYRFVLPKDRAPLWIQFVGVGRNTKNPELAFRVLNSLFDPEVHKKIVESNQQASVLNSLDASPLPPMQKARYIRQVPLSRVELFINREATEPTWTQTLKDLGLSQSEKL